MNKNTSITLFLMLAANSCQALGSFNFYVQTSFPPMPCCVYAQPACNFAIGYSSCCPSPVHRMPAPICPAATYAPHPLPAYQVDDVDHALAEMADYTIANFCNQQPIVFQQTSWYTLRDMSQLGYQISHNWPSFIDAHGEYIHCPYNHTYTPNPNVTLNAILNNLAHIKTTALMPHCVYPTEERFQLVTGYIAQDLRSIAYITDVYTNSYRNVRALEDIAFYLDRIARNFEGLAYCY